MAFEGFGKYAGPCSVPRSLPRFGNTPSRPNPKPFDNKNQSVVAQQLKRRQQLPKRQQTPPQSERLQTHANMQLDNGNAETSKRIRPPPLAFESIRVIQKPAFSHEEAQRPHVCPPRLGSPRKSPVNYEKFPPQQSIRQVESFSDTHNTGTLSPPKSSFLNSTKRARSPASSVDVLATSSMQPDSEGEMQAKVKQRAHFDVEISQPMQNLHDLVKQKPSGNKHNQASLDKCNGNEHSELACDSASGDSLFDTEGPESSQAVVGVCPDMCPGNLTKRARLADVLATSSTQPDSQREMQAKVKRQARFNVERSPPMQKLHDCAKNKPLGNKHNQASLEKFNVDEHSELACDLSDSLLDTEGPESSHVVVGLCLDMCPESERVERERKGDLDRYERLDGRKNQTSKFLAVKKYNRTAKQEADLIRPMPVLQKTVDYLLSLLDQSYNDNFLSIYNFLWDRMRAIRIDLRMQHIFNKQAIIMLEQMIRLHIIAMHELCECKKSKGFSEGFDKHLNIEQMNKTSVELFQMYNDHRKKGISVPTEKEFRGYYALLKLDKHPGCKVEVSELSLDLSKMTPEIRRTPEIIFARDVARAYRIGNYIAFFRLARKATYLQACLMHAHFAKLRTQALATLHCGLQNNQGIPIARVVDWLAMEEDDVEGLLEYHGFVLKKYDEMYMVKEGPFLNSDMYFPTKCAKLVHLKKSKRIIDDVCSVPTISDCSAETVVSAVPESIDQRIESSKTEDQVDTSKEEVHDSKSDYDFRDATQTKQLLVGLLPATANKENDVEMTEIFVPLASQVTDVDSVRKDEDEEMTELDGDTSMGEGILPQLQTNIVQAAVPGFPNSKCMVENTTSQTEVGKSLDNEASKIILCQKNEVASEKPKLFIRKWKRRARLPRVTQEQRKLLANAALSSLPLGPPVRRIEAKPPRHASSELNIDYVARERYIRHQKSWSTLNISELVAPILSEKNPNAKCLCWKLLIFVQDNVTEGQTNPLASRWLLSKLMGSGKEDDELMVSSPHLSIWKKWINKSSPSETCCLSVIRVAMFDHQQQVAKDDIIAGTSCILFLASESISWEIQRVQLQNLLASIPCGSNLPLLIVVGDAYKEEIADPPSVTIIERLGLHDANKTRVNLFSVIFLADRCPQEHFHGFLNDDKLREGLRWLADCSPPQPSLSLVRTHELALSYLRSSLRDLDNCNASEVSPECCILAFNQALDRVAEEILKAASMNPIHWPCPEIALLEGLTSERMIADMFLPSIGWSSLARIEPLTRAIKGCKLPNFTYDLSFLSQGSHMGSQIPNQKLAFEDCLIKYLTQSSQLLNWNLAVQEASVMVQKGAGLELHGSRYYMIPRWVTIFRRICNWRLVDLRAGEASVAYALDPSVMDSACKTDADKPMNPNSGMQDFESRSSWQQPLHSVSNALPPFDEIFQVCCGAF